MKIEDIKQLEAKVKKLQTNLARAQRKKSEAEGELKAIAKQLRDEFSCGSVKEADRLLKTTADTLEDLGVRMQECLSDLQDEGLLQ